MSLKQQKIFLFLNNPHLIVCWLLLWSPFVWSQIKEPQKPIFNLSRAYESAGLEYFQNTYYSYSQPAPTYHAPVGTTADDIIRQTNTNISLPIVSGVDVQRNQQATIAYIQKKARQTSEISSRENELLNILNEAHNIESAFSSRQAITQPYQQALQQLKGMLEGKTLLSIKQAYFAMEKAYGNVYLTQTEYDAIIKESADFIRKWLAQNHYDLHSSASLHTGIQRFMSDTLSITYSIPDKPNLHFNKKHLPFAYDYEDFKGENDFRNFFLTKTLATGSGQCNSLPGVYLVLAEALNVPVYLSFAPYHALIKYPGDGGLVHNYESTSNWNITDEWYMEHLFIGPEAIRSGIYLDTMNKKQIVANCILDLAHSYLMRFGLGDGTFMADCLQEAVGYFPRQNNITAHFLYSSCLARKLDKVLRENDITDLKDITKAPGAVELYKALAQNEERIKNLGYQEPPRQLYENMLQQSAFKGKRQQSTGFSGKQKRNMFINH